VICREADSSSRRSGARLGKDLDEDEASVIQGACLHGQFEIDASRLCDERLCLVDEPARKKFLTLEYGQGCTLVSVNGGLEPCNKQFRSVNWLNKQG
jgi:hypothetical protein